MDNEEIRFSKHQLSISILEIYNAENKSLNRYNVIGRPYQRGPLEIKLNINLTPRERALAYKALRELEDRGMIIPTYGDMVSPGDWLTITEWGLQALKSGALDEFDYALLKLASEFDLVSMRYGAHDAIASRHTDWQRHAATSCRELITKVLHAISPDEEVVKDPEFVKDPTASNGITRAERVRHYLRKNLGRVPKKNYTIIEGACDLVESCYEKLNTITHTDNKQQVSILIGLTESTITYILSNQYE